MQKQENNVYPYKSQLYYINVGYKVYTLHGHVSVMEQSTLNRFVSFAYLLALDVYQVSVTSLLSSC